MKLGWSLERWLGTHPRRLLDTELRVWLSFCWQQETTESFEKETEWCTDALGSNSRCRGQRGKSLKGEELIRRPLHRDRPGETREQPEFQQWEGKGETRREWKENWQESVMDQLWGWVRGRRQRWLGLEPEWLGDDIKWHQGFGRSGCELGIKGEEWVHLATWRTSGVFRKTLWRSPEGSWKLKTKSEVVGLEKGWRSGGWPH